MNSEGCCSECFEAGVTQALDAAAKIARDAINPDRPGDELSNQAENIAAKILELKH